VTLLRGTGGSRKPGLLLPPAGTNSLRRDATKVGVVATTPTPTSSLSSTPGQGGKGEKGATGGEPKGVLGGTPSRGRGGGLRLNARVAAATAAGGTNNLTPRRNAPAPFTPLGRKALSSQDVNKLGLSRTPSSAYSQ
jgi:hypothetical protein